MPLVLLFSAWRAAALPPPVLLFSARRAERKGQARSPESPVRVGPRPSVCLRFRRSPPPVLECINRFYPISLFFIPPLSPHVLRIPTFSRLVSEGCPRPRMLYRIPETGSGS